MTTKSSSSAYLHQCNLYSVVVDGRLIEMPLEMIRPYNSAANGIYKCSPFCALYVLQN